MRTYNFVLFIRHYKKIYYISYNLIIITKFKYFTINYVFFKLSKNINFLLIIFLIQKISKNYNIIFSFYKIYFSRSVLRNLIFFSIIIKNKVLQFLHSISKTKINVFVINFNETTIIVKHNKKNKYKL